MSVFLSLGFLMCLLRFVQTSSKNVLPCPAQICLFFCSLNSKNTLNATFTNPIQSTRAQIFGKPCGLWHMKNSRRKIFKNWF